MKCIVALLILLVGTLRVCAQTDANSDTEAEVQQATESTDGVKQEKGAGNKELAAIKRAIKSYVDAFNKGDAKSLSTHWSERGEVITPNGATLSGRGQLEETFSKYFGETKDAKLELVDTSIEILSPSVAVESGIARVIASDQEPSETVYEAIHVKTTEGWKIDSLREEVVPAPTPSHYDELQDLEWMIGRWIDEGDTGAIDISCRWTTNRNFIMRSFKVFVEGRVDFEGTQIIGWDPHAKTIRSWVFDSDGGFGVGRWSGEGNRWTAKTLNVLPDGRRGSSTNVYDVVDDNTVQYQSIGRQVDGELLPSIEPVVVIRAADE